MGLPLLHKVAQPILLRLTGKLNALGAWLKSYKEGPGRFTACPCHRNVLALSLPMPDLLAPAASRPQLQLLDVNSALALLLALLERINFSFPLPGEIPSAEPLILERLPRVLVGGQSSHNVLFIHDLVQVPLRQEDVIGVLVLPSSVGEVLVVSIAGRVLKNEGLFNHIASLRLLLKDLVQSSQGFCDFLSPIAALRPRKQALLLNLSQSGLSQSGLAVHNVTAYTVEQLNALHAQSVEGSVHPFGVLREVFLRTTLRPINRGLKSS